MVQHKPSYEAISLAAPSEFDLRCEERLVQFMTGMANIRDVIPFPRVPGAVEV